jgi:TRAP-type C4-dicarboxylate transport system permease large subunit
MKGEYDEKASFNILLLFLGMIMDVAPLIVIVTPVLLPVVQAVGMSPVTFGIVLMVNMAIGSTTPPVGAGLFLNSYANLTFNKGIKVASKRPKMP